MLLCFLVEISSTPLSVLIVCGVYCASKISHESPESHYWSDSMVSMTCSEVSQRCFQKSIPPTSHTTHNQHLDSYTHRNFSPKDLITTYNKYPALNACWETSTLTSQVFWNKLLINNCNVIYHSKSNSCKNISGLVLHRLKVLWIMRVLNLTKTIDVSGRLDSHPLVDLLTVNNWLSFLSFKVLCWPKRLLVSSRKGVSRIATLSKRVIKRLEWQGPEQSLLVSRYLLF